MSQVQNGPLGTRFIGFIERYPKLSILLSIVFLVAIAQGLPRLKANFTHTAFFKNDDPMLKQFNAFERQFGNDDAVVVVVHSPSGIFDLDSTQLLQRLTNDMWKVPEVIRVDSLSNFQWVHASGDDIAVEPLIPDDRPLTIDLLNERKKVALAHEVLPDYLIAKDAQTAIIYARIKPGIDAPPNTKVIVTATRELLKKYQQSDHVFHITGGPAINYAFQEVSTHDTSRIVPLVVLMVIVLLFVAFRQVSGVLLPLGIAVTAIISAFSFGGWLGIELSTITVILPQILIAVSVADAVHILATYYRARRHGKDRREAAGYSLRKNLLPTILTSVTTAIGFVAFMSADLKPIVGLGILAGIGTMVAWLMTYTILGAALYILPLRVKLAPKSDEDLDEDALSTARPWAKRYTEFVFRYRKAIIVAFGIGAVASAAISMTNTVNSDPYKYFSHRYPLRQAQDFVLTHFGGLLGFELVIDAKKTDGIKDPQFLKRVEQFEKKAITIPGISKTVSLVDIVRQTNRSLNGGNQSYYRLPDTQEEIAQELFLYTMSLPQGMDINDRVTVKNDALRISIISSVTDSATWTKTADELVALAKSLNLDAVVTGKGMLYQSMNGYVVSSFVNSIAWATLQIGLLLMIAFRSVRIGIIAMIPNVIPLFFAGVILKLIGASLDIGTVLVCSICLGIAVDDTIHVLANYLRAVRSGTSPKHAMALLMTHTSPALTVTTAVLVGGFGALALATFVPNIYFGIMTAITLTVALLTDMFMTPALLLSMAVKDAQTAGEQPALSLATD